MCMVSVIYAHFQSMPDDWYTPQRIELFHTLVAQAEIFDEEAGQPDCLDPEKSELDKKLEQLGLAFKSEEDEEDDYRGADYD